MVIIETEEYTMEYVGKDEDGFAIYMESSTDQAAQDYAVLNSTSPRFIAPEVE